MEVSKSIVGPDLILSWFKTAKNGRPNIVYSLSPKCIDLLNFLEYAYKFNKRTGTLTFTDPVHAAIFTHYVKNPKDIDEVLND